MILNASTREPTNNRVVLLWTNADLAAGGTTSRNATFPATELELDLSPYKLILITIQLANNIEQIVTRAIVNDSSIVSQLLFGFNAMTEFSREVSVTQNGLLFTTGQRSLYADDGNVTTTPSTAVAIPYHIYGYY